MNKFIAISEHGKLYFLNKYPQLQGKVDTHYLGIEIDKSRKVNIAPDGVIRVVSCGRVNAHKNIIGIFRALNKMGNIEWFHIGDGDGLVELQMVVNREKTISVNLMGGKTQAEIREIYSMVDFTCFISLSTTEGLPVSMMEALSYGIPIVSTDVGGCSEIVNDNTGVLLKSDYKFDDVKEAVLKCHIGPLKMKENRIKMQEECVNKFNAPDNYHKFYEYLELENQKHLNTN